MSDSSDAAPPPPQHWGAPDGPPAPSVPDAAKPGPVGVIEHVRRAVADVDEAIDGTQLPFDSLRSMLEWWYRPLLEAKSWIAFGSLFVGAIWGPLMFAAVVVVASTTFGLAFTGIGVLLVVPAFGFVNGLARVERARAGWVGAPIEAPHLAVAGPSVWSRIGTPLRDGARWRQLLFFGLFLVAGPALFALGALPWVVLLQSIFGSSFDPTQFSPFGFIVAALLAGGAPRITNGVAWLGRAFTETLLGPNEAVELQERVSELSGQRQQILDAVAIERRRIERNLHDGVQQQLVALGIDIGRAKSRIDEDPDGARELLDAARDKVRGSIGELRMIGRGLHPAVLGDRGIDAALSAVVADAPLPIAVSVTTTALLPDDIASTAYYVASEAVANMMKHAQARVGSIRLEDDSRTAGAVRLTVHDDGRGGADPSRGSGLAGMRARVEGVDGVLDVDSPRGGPTTIVAVLPLPIASASAMRTEGAVT